MYRTAPACYGAVQRRRLQVVSFANLKPKGKKLDKISLNGINAMVVIGTFPEEREKTQPVFADVDIFCDLSRAGRSDVLADTIDYFELEERIFRLMSESRFFLLERLAEVIAQSVLSDCRIFKCRVRLSKPEAMRHSNPVSIEIERCNGDAL